MSTHKKGKSPNNKPYTVGQCNRLIDNLFHPIYEENEWIRLVDGLLHLIVEGNARVSTKKFLKYNLSEIARKILKKT